MKVFSKIAKWLGIGIYVACAALILMFLTPIGGWKALNVLTGSMEPTIMPGTFVLIHHIPLRDIKVGDIVTYQDQHNFKRTITHRVIKIAKVDGVTTITVKGDANPTPDTPFPGGLIVGKVSAAIPGAGKFISWLHNPWWLALLVIIPGLLVIWSEIMRLRRALSKPGAAGSEPDRESDGGNASLERKHQEIHGEARSLTLTPTPSLTPTPQPKPNPIPEPPQRPRRSMDGMRRMSLLLIAPVAVAFAVGTTFALEQVGTVKLTHNTFTAIATSPTPTPTPAPPTVPTTTDQCKNGGWQTFKNPDGSLMFKNQGQCVAFVNSANPGQHTTSTTTVTITNTNNQSATSGSVSGGGTSGNASNTNNSSSTVNVTN